MDGAGCHRLEPQPANRLARLEGFDDLAKNEFTFTARVARVDDLIDIVALQEFANRLNPIALPWLRLQPELAGQNWQRIKGPALVLRVDLFGCEQFEQVPDCERNEIGIVLEVFVVVREAAEDTRDIARDTGLLGDYEGFTQRFPAPWGGSGSMGGNILSPAFRL